MDSKKTAHKSETKSTFQAAVLTVIQNMLHERNYRQKKLAEAWQVDQSTVSRVFSGTTPISIAKIEQAANLFNVDIYTLLHEAHNYQMARAAKLKAAALSTQGARKFRIFPGE